MEGRLYGPCARAVGVVLPWLNAAAAGWFAWATVRDLHQLRVGWAVVGAVFVVVNVRHFVTMRRNHRELKALDVEYRALLARLKELEGGP